MGFNNFILEILNLVNKSNNNINVVLTPQNGYIVDILVSINEDVIIDTSINYSFQEAEQNKMNKIIRVISEYC